MSRLILLGNPETKRAVYLKKGAEKAGAEVEVLDWREFPHNFEEIYFQEEEIFLKIDPPLWNSCCLEELDRLVLKYEGNLDYLAASVRSKGITFLNHPQGIKELLDKRGCKRRLKKAGIPVTEELETESTSAILQRECEYPLTEQLLDTMERQKIFQVFIKPNHGSGAAGVMAFRYEPRKGQTALYTCAAEQTTTGSLVNTKRLRRFTDRRKVCSIVEGLLKTDCIVERWYAKAENKGFSYDLRAVVQDGKIDFMLARLSAGPITNLQLNNHPLRAEELGLSSAVKNQVEQVCRQAAACWPSLRSVGVDILLERRSLRPRVIEMNGQGDLIYQDIYGENKIYCRQAEMMKRWQQGEKQQTGRGGSTD